MRGKSPKRELESGATVNRNNPKECPKQLPLTRTGLQKLSRVMFRTIPAGIRTGRVTTGTCEIMYLVALKAVRTTPGQ